MPRYLQPEEATARDLERGKAVRRFSHRHRPEHGTLKIRRETGHIIWVGAQGVREVITSLADIKEVRPGKGSKDFEKWQEEARREERAKCFIVFYGKEFKLRTLSIAAIAPDECTEWINGLKYLKEEALNVPYTIRLERTLRTEFYNMENQNNRITFRDVRNFLPRIHYKMTNNQLKQLFDQVDDRSQGEIGFDQFFDLVKKIAWDKDVDRMMFENARDVGEKSLLDKYCCEGKVSLQDFQLFLVEEQKEPEDMAGLIIKNFISDVQRDIMEPYFHVEEFVQYLFSKSNELWDRRNDSVNQDMTKSMSQYWIASSHNTDSSTEAYARVLRQGCRCIELDCWDGPDGVPNIYHGFTLTSKISFKDVINTINEHAFVASEYPVILSIEQHCSMIQQKEMAELFQKVFGDSLLTAPLSPNEKEMPSPEQLKRKIIIKHKKLPEGMDEATPPICSANDSSAQSSNEEFGGEMDLSKLSFKGDRLYLRNPVDQTAWQPHFFALTQDRLHFTELQNEEPESEDQHSGRRMLNDVSEEEWHLHEPWYHGRLPGGRAKAEELVHQNSHLGDGTFLVRFSENFVGDHTLTFWYRGKVSHCRIRVRQEGDNTRYWLKDNDSFDTLYGLIEHYKHYPILSQEVSVKLGEAVPQPNSHERMEWYHANMTRDEAEQYLGRIPEDGAFLVRPSGEAGSIAISFKAERRTKHCRVKQEDGTFIIGTATFDSLVELIKYYERNFLFRRVKLRYPVTERVIQGLQDMDPVDGTGGYVVDPAYVSNIHVKAKYSYRANKDDELTFPRHAIIQNVIKAEKEWWTGDYGGRRQHWFPAIFVEEIEPENMEERGGDNQVLGSLQKGSIDISRAGTKIEKVTGTNRWGIVSIIKLTTQTGQVVELACTSEQQAQEWVKKIESVSSPAAVNQTRQTRKPEQRIKQEMSNLVVYFRAVRCDPSKQFVYGGTHNEVSSFPENRMESLMLSCPKGLLKFHKVGFSRVYPKSSRLDSTNYNPVPMWNHGCQMVCLNYQTGDKPMQLNEGRQWQNGYMQNGKCGYILRPEFQNNPDYDPGNPLTLPNPRPLNLSIKIFGARHLSKSGKGFISPLVEVEIIGCEYDNAPKYTTRAVHDNGLNPVWGVKLMFSVHNPECALIRFVLYDEDMFGEPNQIGQATYPVTCIREGYRSVPLKNGYSEEIELASLLVHMKITREDEQMILLYRKQMITMLDEAREKNNLEMVANLEDRIQRLEQEILQHGEQYFFLDPRSRRWVNGLLPTFQLPSNHPLPQRILGET
ncbi:putative 1-phosphatidylinositol 4,5-bisphosphate phosphodiesterase gamma-1 isoform X1 [Penaeus vannamei]|uniref:Phosphoinositide phospholipase C n=1 Tax=Penaeus vannamei TaxID=6689 RepID=A0A3R7T0Z4_PENVA|nr:putative 1-phosphatidylinositol 4,5-bisphosphate phosphodiesterase gamma-1 isoform X1 [Penaeus vannamei]